MYAFSTKKQKKLQDIRPIIIFVEPGQKCFIRHPRLDRGSPIMDNQGYIYFMTNAFGNVLYIGVTNSLKRRIIEHQEGLGAKFTHKYNCNKLVYYESFPDIRQAITREKQLKHFKRAWKNELVKTVNPQWRDLSEEIIIDPAIV